MRLNPSLESQEVLQVLRAQLHVDAKRLERDLPELIENWKKSDDLLQGLRNHVRRHYQLADREGNLLISDNEVEEAGAEVRSPVSGSVPPLPETEDNYLDWASRFFDFFDEDGDGELNQQEVARGIILTLQLENEPAESDRIANFLHEVWSCFDHDGNGTVDKSGKFHFLILEFLYRIINVHYW